MGEAFFDEAGDVPQGLVDVFARSTIALSLADIARPDCPLVGVNKPFLDLTGYAVEAVLNANCRFLQPAGGAGPVRDRMRHFIESAEEKSGRFLIANVRRDGRPFLNLLYMTKLTRNGGVRFILGSQFDVGPRDATRMAMYDAALNEDMRRLNVLTCETNWVVLGSLEAIASSHSIIAQARIE